MIRAYASADWPSVEQIYREGIATGNATFEAEPSTRAHFESKPLILVAADGNVVHGWAAAAPVSTRDVYRGVVEHSVYVDSAARGRGVGHELLDALLREAAASGIWMLQASIFPENEASLALHDAHGFRRVGTRERIALQTYGPYAGHWRDTILVEKRL
jgi:phosphinothricin acetyltransferase